MAYLNAAEATSSRTSSHWRRRIMMLLGGVLLIAWFLPTLIAQTPVLGWLVRTATSSIKGSVHVGSASLGWLSPVILQNVTVRDAAGEPLMTVPTVKSDSSLVEILLHPSKPGRFHCEKAALEVVFTKEATNLEKALAKLFTAEEGSPSRGVDKGVKASSPLMLALDFKEARVTIHDGAFAKPWVLEPVTIHVGLNQENAPALQIQVQAVVAGSSPGLLHLDLTQAAVGAGRTVIKGRMDNVPLALAAPVLRRFEPGIQLEGRLRGQWDMTWSKGQGHFEGELVGQDCLASGAMLGEDQLQLAQVQVPWKLSYDGHRLLIEKAQLVCDVGHVAIQGNLDLDYGPVVRHDGPDLDLAIDIDLARLIERLPRMVRLRPDTRVIAGRLSMACKGVAQVDGAILWRGNANATDVRGVRAGQNIAWPRPLALTFQVRQTANNLPAIELLRSESEFLKLDADSSPGKFTVMAKLDLTELAQPLNQFFEMNQVRLEGTAGLEVTVLQKEPDCFQLAGAGFLRSFHCQFGQGKPWHEEAVTLAFHGDGTNLPDGSHRIENGFVHLECGQDILDVQSLSPIADLVSWPRGSLQVKLAGDMTRWQNRASPWTNTLNAWQLHGTTETQANVRWSENGVDFTTLIMANRDFQCIGPGLKVSEPAFELQAAAGHLEFAAGRANFKDALIRCPSLVMLAPTLQVAALDDKLIVAGAATAQGDLERVGRWLVAPGARPDVPSTADAAVNPMGFTSNVNLTRFVLAKGAGPNWHEALGDGGLSWNSLKAYGCDVGPGKVRATLRDGWLQLTPIETTLNGGRMRLSAELQLRPGSVQLQLARGLVVERAQLTPEMCSGALGYVVPALAGATDVQGLVSLSIEGGQLDLTDMTRSELKGTFTLHSARLGAGPLVKELSALLRAPGQTNLVKETQVPFQVVGGRVHHQNLELVFPDFTIRTSGSVGMDGTLILVAEMPVPPRWLVNNPLAATLAKQTVRLPIGGTIDHPRLDPQALQAANAEFLRNAASDALRQGLDGQLMKFLGGR